MQDEPRPKQDSAVGLTRPPWHVTRVDVTGPYRLRVEFVDGVVGEVDLSRLIFSAGAGVFAPLRDLEEFDRVRVDAGAVVWPGGQDLAPDAMHDRIQRFGGYTA